MRLYTKTSIVAASVATIALASLAGNRVKPAQAGPEAVSSRLASVKSAQAPSGQPVARPLVDTDWTEIGRQLRRMALSLPNNPKLYRIPYPDFRAALQSSYYVGRAFTDISPSDTERVRSQATALVSSVHDLDVRQRRLIKLGDRDAIATDVQDFLVCLTGVTLAGAACPATVFVCSMTYLINDLACVNLLDDDDDDDDDGARPVEGAKTTK